jgi:hypothetical protein
LSDSQRSIDIPPNSQAGVAAIFGSGPGNRVIARYDFTFDFLTHSAIKMSLASLFEWLLLSFSSQFPWTVVSPDQSSIEFQQRLRLFHLRDDLPFFDF